MNINRKIKNNILVMLIGIFILMSCNNAYAAEITTCNYKDTVGNTITIKLNKSTNLISATSNFVDKCVGKEFVSGDNLRLSYDTYVDYYDNNKVKCEQVKKIYASIPDTDYYSCNIDIIGSNSQSEFTLQESKVEENKFEKSCLYSVDDGKLTLYKETTDDVSEYSNSLNPNYGKYVVITLDTNAKKITSNNASIALGSGSSLSKNLTYDKLVDSSGNCKSSISYSERIDGGEVGENKCTYVGQQTGIKMEIYNKKVTFDDKKTNDDFNGNIAYGNVTLPSDLNNCQAYDIFYSRNHYVLTSIQKNQYTDLSIKQLCHYYPDIEQFCSNGACNIDNPLCGGGSELEDEGSCPSQLRPAIVFIKRAVINTLQLFIPILLILMGTIDMTKAVMSNDDKGLKDATARLIRRIIIAILFFFITTIVTLVIGRIASSTDIDDGNSWKACWNEIK